MKKLIIALFLSLLFVNVGYGASNNDRCDQTFPSIKLRYGKSYSFYDEFSNPSKAPYKIKGFQAIFSQKGNAGNDISDIAYTDWLKGKKGIVNPGERGKAVEFTEEYLITRYPEKRLKDNVYIRYIADYVTFVDGKEIGNIKQHIECQPYEITWCGDGILDREFGETCDPNDPSRTGWGSGGCDEKTCKPKETPSECKTLTATPTTGEAPFTTNLTCEGVNSKNFKIDVKNNYGNILKQINGKTGSYTFTNPGTYTATCYADNKTSASCQQIITVKPKPKPESACINLEAKVSVEKGETSTFTCNGKNTDNYKIKIVDTKGTVLKEILGRTGTYVFQEKGSYLASCYVDNKTITEPSCVKPVSVTDPIEPRIKVDKTDKNPKDQDGIQENDTQTIDSSLSEKAVFKITVRNSGTEDLENISLRDDVEKLDVDAPMCEKTVSEVNQILQSKFGRTFLRPGESFDYTCERQNDAGDPEEYVNRIFVEGQGKISLKRVKDEDPTRVNKPKKPEPKIKVDKRDNNPNDLDKIIGDNDSQTVKMEDKAIFKITVTNNGTEDLVDVSLVDDVLNSKVDAPSCDKSIDEVNNILKNIGNRDTVFNVGETFNYTCERQNQKDDPNPYTNLIKVTGIGIKSRIPVKDEDPTVVKKDKEPKIKVDKTDKNPEDKDGVQENDTQTVEDSTSAKAVFKITVRNDGTEDLDNISLTDDVIESDVEAPMCDKSVAQVNQILQSKFGRTYLKPGESFDYTCERQNHVKDPAEYVNKITTNGQGRVSLKKVRDDDTTRVKKGSECQNLQVNDKNFECRGKGTGFKVILKGSKGVIKEYTSSNKGSFSGTIDLSNDLLKDVTSVECLNGNDKVAKSECKLPYTPKIVEDGKCESLQVKSDNTFECRGTSKNFTILYKDANGRELTNPYRFTADNSGVVKGRIPTLTDLHRVECLNGDERIAKEKCSVVYGNTPKPKAECTNLEAKKTGETSYDFTCNGKGSDDYTIYVNEGNTLLKQFKGRYANYTFEKNKTYNIQCVVGTENSSVCNKTITTTPPGGGGGGGGGNGGGGGGKKEEYCGDGIVQRPSRGEKNKEKFGVDYIMEECDQGSMNGKPNSWCNERCELEDPLTYPGERFFEFGPKAINIIGQGMNPYTTYNDTLPYIENTNQREGSIYVSKICVTSNSVKFNEGGKKLFNFDYICEDVKKELNKGDKITMSKSLLEKVKAGYFKNLPKQERDKIRAKGYRDEYLVTTIITKDTESVPKFHETHFLSSGKEFTSRVTYGSIRTIGGGVTYVGGKDVAYDFKEIKDGVGKATNVTTNFTGVSIADFLDKVTNDNLKKDIQNQSGNIQKTFEDWKGSNNSSKSTDVGDFKEYRGITGAYVLSGKGFTITGDNVKKLEDKVKGPKTFIIEGGDLHINTNIKFAENVAFVVKGGDIKFGENVTRAEGTFIAVRIGPNGGSIDSVESSKQLMIVGSLYGNVSKLISNRTYMKVNEDNNIDVGTIVSYGSSAFRKPAPLLSTFVDEYVRSTKVVK